MQQGFVYYTNTCVQQYSSFDLTSVWYARSLTVLEFIIRFLRMNDRDH